MASRKGQNWLQPSEAGTSFSYLPYLYDRKFAFNTGCGGASRHFCAIVGKMTEEMIKEYLEHHFEPNPSDNFKMEPD